MARMPTASSFIDITLPLSRATPAWPGDAAVEIRSSGGVATVSELRLSSHAGTHIDAPAHFFPHGKTIDQVPLETLIGPAWVARVDGAAVITADLLERAEIPTHVTRLLLATDNSRGAGPSSAFDRDFVACDGSAIRWLVDRDVRLVGVDGPSVDPFAGGSFDGHRALLAREVVIVENLALRGVAPGPYRLICLPLRLERGDGAPGRVTLEALDYEESAS